MPKTFLAISLIAGPLSRGLCVIARMTTGTVFRGVGPNFSFETKNKQKNFPDSSYYKKYNGNCFIYLCEILNKLQICVILLINHTHLIFFYFPLVILTN